MTKLIPFSGICQTILSSTSSVKFTFKNEVTMATKTNGTQITGTSTMTQTQAPGVPLVNGTQTLDLVKARK